jgi:hypothetical protein
MFLVDGARPFCRAYDLDRGTKRDRRLYDTVNTQMTGPVLAHYASGARYSFGERLLIVISARICALAGARIPFFPVPTDGAGGVRLR